MKRRILAAFALAALLGCAGLAKDINNGAHNTEREIRGEKRHPPATEQPADDAGVMDQDGSISI